MGKRHFFSKFDFLFIGFNIVVAMFVLGGMIWGLVAYLRSYTEHGIEVEVPSVRGMIVEDALPILEEQGLRLEVIDSTYSEKVPFGSIVEQDPQPQSHAKHGRTVYVTVNASGKRKVLMPDLLNMSSRQAVMTLQGLGLIVDTVYDYEPSIDSDLVLDVKVDGVSIQENEKIPVGTTVRLVVGFGLGTEEVEVPSLIGLTLQEARSRLLDCHLTVGAVIRDEQEQAGQYVYSQTPRAGALILEGDRVTLRLSTDRSKADFSMEEDPVEEEAEWF
jgi:beta-lactam-binding protein with PASTA domain